MLEKVKKYVNKWHMIEKEDRVIVGVSGGADSVCLLFVLSELQKEIPFEMAAVHVNHGLRGEAADADEAYVKKLCTSLGVSLYSYYENVELIAKNRKQSTEEAGREVRRSYFESTMKSCNANKIALAHHKNDNAETLLFHLARGTGLRGLGGMKPVRGAYIRPFLCVTRAEIESYLREKGIEYREDATNATDEYTRNRIRNHVIPFLEKEVNPASVFHMGETMEQLQLVQDYMEGQVSEAFAACVKEVDEAAVIQEESFCKLHAAIKQLVIKELMIRMSGAEKDIEQIHVQAVLDLFEKQVGRQLDLPYQLQAKRVYEGIKILKKQEHISEEIQYDIPVKVGNQGTIFYEGQVLQYRIFENEKENENPVQKSGKCYFDCDIIQNGLIVRTRRPGDYITIHPDGRTQKLKSFFVNEKVPQEIRDRVLLLADGSHILWIVGMRSNCMYQVSNKTKCVLEVQMDKGVYYGRKN